ncbi:V-type ATPase 116kDa subunit family protein [Actinomadura luteofluorescens]|uniref:V-type ATPase 116kDa subunit family protein n=1 Tax=Actinomadura luteofluorescens TaxID=46163 RepID=UPI003629AD94
MRERAAGAVRKGHVAAVVGWMPRAAHAALAARLAEVGAALVRLPHPRGVEAPSLLQGEDRRESLRGSLVPLVATYGPVPYADLDPTPLAWAAYVLMFGIMFGDAGHGLLLLAAAAALLAGRPRRAAPLRRAWPFVLGAGITSTAFGVLYGEFFGPTRVVPRLWLSPLDSPVRLLVFAVGLGAVLLVAPTRWASSTGGGRGLVRRTVRALGHLRRFGLPRRGRPGRGRLLPAARRRARRCGRRRPRTGGGLHRLLRQGGGGGTGAVETVVELFDLVMRLGANVVSFARLAAFGLTHAALAAVVWTGTAALWHHGGIARAVAALVFVFGTALTFALEALVAGVQALRLEYYELFSRLFTTQGRPFRPWHIRMTAEEVDAPCPQV